MKGGRGCDWLVLHSPYACSERYVHRKLSNVQTCTQLAGISPAALAVYIVLNVGVVCKDGGLQQ